MERGNYGSHVNVVVSLSLLQLPSYGPSMWGDGSYDGPGYSLALYWKIPDEISEVSLTSS